MRGEAVVASADSRLTIGDPRLTHMNHDRYQHISDQELLANHRADGDPKWIGVLLQRYTLLLLGVCMKYLKDETEARDCVQQVFLKVLTEVHKYRIEYFKSWLYMVAKNHCLMRIRERGAHPVKELAEQPADPDQNMQDLLANERTYDLLEEALAELNEAQRRCVNLFYLQKKSYAQIGEQTGYTPLQVKSYIQNGKRNLKLILERKLKQQPPR